MERSGSAFWIGTALAASVPLAASAQTAINLNALQGLAPFSTLDNSAAGQAALTANFNITANIQDGAANQPLLLPFAQQQQQALRDAAITSTNAYNLADGLGTKLGGAYQSLTSYTSSNDGTTATSTSISSNVANLIAYTYAITGADSNSGKYFFANETTNGTTPVSAAAAAILSNIGGITNVFGVAYGYNGGTAVTGTTNEPFGDPRPYQTEPSIAKYTGTDFYGVSSSNTAYLTGPTQPLNTSPSFPSGHTTYGYTESLLLAIMVPERFQQMITRAAEYGNDRIILGAHYAMDIIAGRTIAYYDIAQMLANNPTYVGQTEGGVTISNYQTALTSATNDLTSALQTGCGNTIAVCATQDTSRFSSAAANAAFYQSTQTYGLPVVYANETGVQNVNTLAPDAGYLLETRFPYLTLSQRNDVLTSTEGPGGGFLDNGSSFGVYSILDLYTAANGYGSFASTVAITMNASLGGFNAFDTWSNNIAGTGGFTFSAGSTGTLEFSGANTYSGPTTISGGTLVITGSIVSPTTVNPGGTLAGTGTIGALTVSGGTLAPGLPAIASTTGAATIGQLTATGAVSFSSGSVYQVKISPAGASDNLTTSGTATLGGTVQAIPAAGTYKFNQSYAILNAASVSGTFQGLTGLSGLGTAYLPELTYTLNAVDLVLAPNTISSQLPSGSSGNVLAIAGGIDKSLLTGNAPAAFTNLFNVAPSQLPATIKSLSPEAAIAAQTSALQAGGLFLSTMLNPYVMNGGRGTPVSAAATGPALAGASRQYTLAAADMPGWTVWATASGGDTRTDGSASAGTSAVTSQLYGVIAGADYVLSPQARVGFALSAGGTDAGVSDGLGTSAGSFGQIGIDGTYDFGSAYVAAAAGFGYLGFDTTRTIYIGGYDRLKSSSDGTLFGGRAEAGYRMPVGPALLVPYAAVTPQGFSANSATEYGTLAATNFGLIYHGRTTDSVPTELGARGSMAISLAGLNVTAFGRLAWEHEFDRTRTIDASFISSPVGSFSASGAPPAANAALATIGAQVGLENGLILAVAADGSFSGSVNGAGGQVSLRYSW